MLKNESIEVFVWDLTTGEPLLSDLANLHVYLSTDDGDPTELESSGQVLDTIKQPGWYRYPLTLAERQGTKFFFTAVSDTPAAKVIVPPVIVGSHTTGASRLSARISYSSLAPDEYLEIVQGEEKSITFIVEGDGRFDQEVPDSISVKLVDPANNSVTITNADVERITETLELQVFNITLTASDTNSLIEGLMRIEISVDSLKASLTHAVKIVEKI